MRNTLITGKWRTVWRSGLVPLLFIIVFSVVVFLSRNEAVFVRTILHFLFFLISG
jgi:hypothetical protein